MTNTDTGRNQPPSSSQQPNDDQPKRTALLRQIFPGGLQGLLQSAGLILVVVSAFAFVYAIIYLIATKVPAPSAGPSFWQELIGNNAQILAMILIGVLVAWFALRLFAKAGSLTSQVIPDKDRDFLVPLISQPNKDAIGEYIRLASLSGFPGTFHKLGFTGLPLATMVLTLILLGTSVFIDDNDLRKGIFDMAKLTLGAFLGSFVQRNVEQERLIQGTLQPLGGGTGAGAGSGQGGQNRQKGQPKSQAQRGQPQSEPQPQPQARDE